MSARLLRRRGRACARRSLLHRLINLHIAYPLWLAKLFAPVPKRAHGGARRLCRTRGRRRPPGRRRGREIGGLNETGVRLCLCASVWLLAVGAPDLLSPLIWYINSAYSILEASFFVFIKDLGNNKEMPPIDIYFIFILFIFYFASSRCRFPAELTG